MTEYRKKRGTNTWHWSPKCTDWPTEDYDVSYTKPTSGELDSNCGQPEPDGIDKQPGGGGTTPPV